MAQATLTQTVLSVPDITCGHCEQVITTALAPVAGVELIVVDIPARRVQVDYDPARVDLDRISAILAAEEYPIAAVAPGGSSAPEAAAPPVAGCSCCGSNS